MTKKEELLKTAKAAEKLLAEGLKIAAEIEQDKAIGILNRVQATADAISHNQKSEAYRHYKDSEAYVLGLRQEVLDNGFKAVSKFGTLNREGQITQTEIAMKWLDHSTVLTFDELKEGQTVTHANHEYLVTKFSRDYAGSKAVLVCLSSKYFLDGQKITPFSGVPCNFNHSTKQLITTAQGALAPSTVIEISGTKYVAVSQYAEANCRRYELEEVTQ